MKDVRGTGVSAIQMAISRNLRLHFPSKGQKNLQDVLEWKNSKEVGDGHTKLFTDENALDNLTKAAFPSMDDEESDVTYTNYYIYTASMCDIILNPKHQTLEVNKKSLELRMRSFRVFIDFVLLFLKINLLIKTKIDISEISRKRRKH